MTVLRHGKRYVALVEHTIVHIHTQGHTYINIYIYSVEWLTVPQGRRCVAWHICRERKIKAMLIAHVRLWVLCVVKAEAASSNTHSGRHFNELMIYHTPTN